MKCPEKPNVYIERLLVGWGSSTANLQAGSFRGWNVLNVQMVVPLGIVILKITEFYIQNEGTLQGIKYNSIKLFF